MFKFVVLAALISFVSASGHYEHAPVAHVTNVAVHKTVAVPTVVGYGSKVVGEQVVGYQQHHQQHVAHKVITQPIHIVKPATWQQSSGHSIPASGKVISAPIVTHHAVSYGHGGYGGHY